MNRLREFITGWAVTLRIMLFERETYRLLRDWHDLDEFVEVGPPGSSPDSYRWVACPSCGRCRDCGGQCAITCEHRQEDGRHERG